MTVVLRYLFARTKALRSASERMCDVVQRRSLGGGDKGHLLHTNRWALGVRAELGIISFASRKLKKGLVFLIFNNL